MGKSFVCAVFDDLKVIQLKREAKILQSLKPHLLLDLTKIIISYNDNVKDFFIEHQNNLNKKELYIDYKRPQKRKRKRRRI